MERPIIPPQRILVVDDEPYVCDALRMMLSLDGHTVATAGNGQEALALFGERGFDLVITDYSMPAMRGDELAGEIKLRKPGLPVVMITAYAEMLSGNKTPLVGVDALVSKPFRVENLRDAIARVVTEANAA